MIKKQKWHSWFAWHRVTISGENQVCHENDGIVDPPPDKKVWLCWIERRWVPPYGHDKGYYEYKETGA